MKARTVLFGGMAALGLLAGCETTDHHRRHVEDPTVEHGPHGTVAYNVLIEASEPGVRIRANGDDVGAAPMTLKIFGDKDGTFHDFGSYYFVVQALPLHTNQYLQTRYFRTGRHMSGEDRIPQRIYFDMNQPPTENDHRYYYGPRVYIEPPPIWFGPAWGPGPGFGPGPGPGPRFGPGPRGPRG